MRVVPLNITNVMVSLMVNGRDGMQMAKRQKKAFIRMENVVANGVVGFYQIKRILAAFMKKESVREIILSGTQKVRRLKRSTIAMENGSKNISS